MVICPNYPEPKCPILEEALEAEGFLVGSGKFSGMKSEEAKRAVTETVGGEWQTRFRLRDWLISRQRYWGPPIPLIFCEKCKKQVEHLKSQEPNSKELKKLNKGELENPGWFAVSESNLPVILPHLEDFRPTGKGASPLASVASFMKAKCPRCGGAARREADVSDTFLDSAWYYLGYLMASKRWKAKMGSPEFKRLARRWLPVDQYIGGAEHSVLHLLYVRFVAMALREWGTIQFEEPFPSFRAHGLVIKDGAKMSKSKGNVVNPDVYLEKFGADALRMYLMFLAPFEQGGDFRDAGILGVTRFLERVWRFVVDRIDAMPKKEPDAELDRIMHRTIKKVTEDIEALRYNTGVSALMIALNEIEKRDTVGKDTITALLKLLAPFAPHSTEELWFRLNGSKRSSSKCKSIHREPWPAYDPKKVKSETVTIAVQVNGKLRGTVSMERGASEDAVKSAALRDERVAAHVSGRQIRKTIFVPDRIMNFIV